MFVLASYSLCKVSAYCGSSAAVYGDTCSSCILWLQRTERGAIN